MPQLPQLYIYKTCFIKTGLYEQNNHPNLHHMIFFCRLQNFERSTHFDLIFIGKTKSNYNFLLCKFNI